MANLKNFNLPDLGEGLTEGEILKWLVQPGDAVTLNQPIVEVETAKAAVEIPSPYAGVVTSLHHGEGETVDVGSPIITFDTDPDGAGSAMSTAFAPTVGVVDTERRIQGGDLVPSAANPGMAGDVDVPHEPGMVGSPAPKAADEEKIQVLVGSGPKAGSVTRRPRKAVASGSAGGSASMTSVVPPARVSAAGVGAHAERMAASQAEVHVLAKPPVRKLARDLGVDLHNLQGTGPGGVVTREDVMAAATLSAGTPAEVAAAQAAVAAPAPDNSRLA